MKKLIVIVAALCLMILAATTVYAAQWEQNGNQWKYLQDNGQYASNGWLLINGNYYYFDGNGIMLADTMTPDGYYVAPTGEWIQNISTAAKAPDSFKTGYQYGDFSRFNSPASVNGLGNTPIWIEGKYTSVFPVNVTVRGTLTTIYCAHITDTNGNKWLVQLEWDVLGNPEAFYSLINHDICIDGIYEGFSEVYKEPALHAKKVYDINSGVIVSSNYGNLVQ